MAAGGQRGGERGIPVEKVSKFLSFGRIAGQIDSIEFPEEKIKYFRWERDGKDVLLLPDEDGKREKIYEEEGKNFPVTNRPTSV